MSISVQEVLTKKHRREFVYLPEKVHAGHVGWVPPIYSDDMKTFNPHKNLAQRYCENIMYLAYRNNEVVGRIAGTINHRYNDHWNKTDVRFGYLDCFDDEEVVAALLGEVEKWAQGKGMQKLVGPQGFTDQDPEGFLVEGFEHPPNLATYYNTPLLPALVERQGYTKEIDYVVYKVDLAMAITEFYQRAYERARRNSEFRLIEFQRRRQILPYIRPVFCLMNECFAQIYGYSALDEAEMEQLAKKYLFIVDPRFIKVVENSRRDLIGFIIGIPNFADGLRQARGRLFPLGALKMIRARNHSRKIDVYLGGVKEGYRARGVDVLMGYRILKCARDAGFEYLDSHHELETNLRMRAEMERVGGTVYKRFRLYRKELL